MPAAGETPLALLLSLGSPEQVLERIVPEDPLGVADCVACELRRLAYLLDAQRVTRRALARCAQAASAWRGSPPLAAWVRERVAEAIEDVRCAERTRPAEREPGAFEAIAPPLGLSAPPLRSACARFNRLTPLERQTFFGVLIEGQPLEGVARRAGLALQEAARGVRRGLELFRTVAPAPRAAAVRCVAPRRRERAAGARDVGQRGDARP